MPQPGQSGDLQGHQGEGEQGEDVDEVGPDWEGAGGPSEGAHPGRAHGVRLRVQPGVGGSLCRQGQLRQFLKISKNFKKFATLEISLIIMLSHLESTMVLYQLKSK